MTYDGWPCCCGDNILEEYYGYRCRVCDTRIAFGCEPWAPLDDTLCEGSGAQDCDPTCHGAILEDADTPSCPPTRSCLDAPAGPESPPRVEQGGRR